MNIVNEILSFKSSNADTKTTVNTEVRNHTITVRVTAEEKERFYQIMKDRRINPSEFLRDYILNLEK